MKEKFTVSGMTCAACSAGIERAVRKLKGVSVADVSLMGERMTVEYDETLLKKEDILNAVTGLGYGICDYDETVLKEPTGFPNSINKAIFSWFAGRDRQGNPCGRGNPHADGHSKKAAATLQTESLQPFFRNKKPQVPYLQTLVFLPHLSSSSDLRILSSTQPSQD